MIVAVMLLACVTNIPNFAFRTFLPVLGVALIARFGGVSLGGAWLTLDFTIFILLLLSLLEHFAPALLYPIERLIKSAAGFLVSQSLVTGDSAILLKYIESVFLNIDHIGASGGLTTFGTTMPYISSTLSTFDQLAVGGALASFVVTFLSFIWAGIIAFAIWWLTTIRRGVLDAIRELDEDDELGLRKIINWSEEGWVIGGVVVSFMFPPIAIGMFLLTLLGLFLAKKYMEHQERKSLVPCPTCNEAIHASAITCFSCRHPNPTPLQVNWLGQPKRNQPVTDLNLHRLQLVGRKRCPECATRLKEKGIQQTCTACLTETFANPQQVSAFLTYLNQQLPKTLVVCFFLSLVPLVGLIPGVIYYRISLISNLRGYIPRSTGCLTQWGVRLMNLILIGFQAFPGVGAFMLPLMCLTNFWIYEGSVKGRSRKAFGRGGWERERAVAE